MFENQKNNIMVPKPNITQYCKCVLLIVELEVSKTKSTSTSPRFTKKIQGIQNSKQGI
jgi:hypothetical protein